MPIEEFFFAAGFLMLEIALVFLCFTKRVWKEGTKSQRVVLFLSTQALGVFFLLFGGYAESRGQFYSLLRSYVWERNFVPSEQFTQFGDPSLLNWLRQQPVLPRPDFTSAEAFRRWQTSLRHTLLTEVFNIPDIATSVVPRVSKETSVIIGNRVSRTFLTFESFDGTSIPAYLFLPSLPLPRPAIIVLHGHVGGHESGIVQTAGIVDSYQHKAAFALASAGYVTFTMEFRGFGYLGTDADEHVIAYNALLGGSFYKAILCKDIKYGFDFLRSLDEVDPQRVGITGVSYGGEMAVTYAALDERIKVVVFQGFGGEIGAQRGKVGLRQNPLHYCHVIPGHNLYILQEDLFFLIAPRPLLGVRGNLDSSEDVAFSETMSKAYNSLGASSAFQFQIASGGHEYFLQPAVQFFEQYL